MLAAGPHHLTATLGIVYERVRYKSLARKRPGPGWQRTGERVVDPETGNMAAAYFRPSDDKQMYVEK